MLTGYSHLRDFRQRHTSLHQDPLCLHRQSLQHLRRSWEGSLQGKIAHQELCIQLSVHRSFVFQRYPFAYYLLFAWAFRFILFCYFPNGAVRLLGVLTFRLCKSMEYV